MAIDFALAIKTGGNTATKDITLRDKSTTTISRTDSGMVNIVDDEITVQITWLEALSTIDGFAESDLSVTGGTIVSGSFSQDSTYSKIYPVRIKAGSDSTADISVTILADAVTGATSSQGNSAASFTQSVDTDAPEAPTINDVASDNIINSAESTSVSGFSSCETNQAVFCMSC